MASKSSLISLVRKRFRSANWEHMEKTILRDCIKDHLSIVESTSCDTNTNRRKQLAWKQILERFNSQNFRERSLLELKQQWRTLKLASKKYLLVSATLKKTGEGIKPPSPDTQENEEENAESINTSKKNTESNNTKDSDTVLADCVRAEYNLKLKQMAEIHQLRLCQMKEAHEWKREVHLLDLEERRIKLTLLQLQKEDDFLLS